MWVCVGVLGGWVSGCVWVCWVGGSVGVCGCVGWVGQWVCVCVGLGVLIDVAAPQRGDQVKQVFMTWLRQQQRICL